MSVRGLLRRWLGVPEVVQDDGSVSRSLHLLHRQMGELRGLVAHQTDFTIEALRRAGWQSEEDLSQQEALQRALRVVRGDGDVLAGPWTGEVGFELLYWIPFLNWLVEQGLDPQRLVIMSRGGAAPWYRHLTSRYVDVLDVITADEFRERTAGSKKQYSHRRDLDRELIDKATAQLGLLKITMVHPSAMYRLFAGLWRRRATLKLVESFTAFRALAPLDATGEETPAGIPGRYVAAKFYFSKAFPDNAANRRFVRDVLQRVSRQMPVVLMSSSVRLDEHSDFEASRASGVFVVDAHVVPHRNLERQTRLICGSCGFIGTYGGFAYLAPFYGVRSVSFFSRRFAFEPHHLELADRVFDRLLPGGFVALHRTAADLVEPAVSRWAAGTQARAAVDEAAPEGEEASVAQ